MAETKAKSRNALIRRVVVSVVMCVLLLALAGWTSHVIFSSEPTAQREGATRRSAALVETIPVERGTFRPRLSVLGVVEPARDVILSPRVGGQIIGLEPGLVPGGIVQAGEPLVRLDPADFERDVTVRESALREVEAELAIEQGMQAAARREFEMLGAEIDETNRALVLREPQIASIRARIASATASLERARLDLARTTVSAPFDAQVLRRTGNVGSQVSPGDELARLVGVDEFWIIASVPPRDLPWVAFPRDGGSGAPVQVRQPTVWGRDVSRAGRVARLIGALDERTRLARVVVTVADPLARATDGPPLILGTIVQLEVEGRPLDDVVRLDRDYLRQNDTVWIMADGALEIRTVDVAFSDADHAYIRSGIDAGESVVTTSLATVTEGLPLRRVGDPIVADNERTDAVTSEASP